MDDRKLTFLVVGAGAIGGITAALMKKAGHDVEIVVRGEEYSSIISEHGIKITGVCGNQSVRIPAYAEGSITKEKKDVIILATKATELIAAVNAYTRNLKDDGLFISLQNGICEEDISSFAGKNRVAGCVTGWGATMESHGKMIMTSTGDFILGYPGREPDDFLKAIAVVLNSVVPTKVTGNITGHKYSKLIINSCITSLGAVSGLYLGRMLSIRKIRRIFIELIREAVAVADKMKIRIEVFSGKLDFKAFIRDSNIISDLYRHLMILAIGFKYRKLKSSSLQSLERGQKTEIDFLNGYIVEHGAALNVDTPVNSAIVKIIHQIESGERQISLANFDDPAFDRFN